jgi:flagellar motor switch protein FliG
MDTKQLDSDSITGPQKAAVFLLAMGEEFTASLFKDLDERSIKKLGKHMSEITYIPSDVLNHVMEEFMASFDQDLNLVVSGKEFLEQVVTKSMDEETAKEVFKDTEKIGQKAPFSDLARLQAEQLVGIIQEEHPQTIALILSHLPQAKAAETLELFPKEYKSDIALRIAMIGHVQEELVNELDDAIKKDLTTADTATSKLDGVETIASILNQVDGGTEEDVMSHIEESDSELAEKIRQKMFVFEDLLEADDRGFREILQNVENQELAKALKTASEEMKEKIFSNLSLRAAEMLKEDMEVMGPVKLSEVEAAQQSILKAAKRLESEGRLVLAGKGKEDILV